MVKWRCWEAIAQHNKHCQMRCDDENSAPSLTTTSTVQYDAFRIYCAIVDRNKYSAGYCPLRCIDENKLPSPTTTSTARLGMPSYSTTWDLTPKQNPTMPSKIVTKYIQMVDLTLLAWKFKKHLLNFAKFHEMVSHAAQIQLKRRMQTMLHTHTRPRTPQFQCCIRFFSRPRLAPNFEIRGSGWNLHWYVSWKRSCT